MTKASEVTLGLISFAAVQDINLVLEVFGFMISGAGIKTRTPNAISFHAFCFV